MVVDAARGTSDEIERVFREVYGHAVATLIRSFGDISEAEDAAQDAFVVAARRWPTDGIPANPAGWIVTTARNRAVDRFRRANRGRELAEAAHQAAIEEADSVTEQEEGPVSDDRLRLIFTCCHPALRPEHQVALTLRLLGGLSVKELAHAFLVTEPAMAKRLVRAKYKIKAANISYRVPASGDLPSRLGAVLSVLYLIYNAGADDLVEGAELRHEGIRLARALQDLLPTEPEVVGLLALLLLNEARVPARATSGATILLRDQHRPDWNRALIAEGHQMVRECIRVGRPGPFQLQAAIQAVHCDAATFEDTDWSQVVTLYDDLYVVVPTPVVALNRAIALAETEGDAAALDAFATIGAALEDYGPFHAARAASLRRVGRRTEAVEAHRRALELAGSATDRAHHQQQIDDLTGS